MTVKVISTEGPNHMNCCDSYNFMAKFNQSSPLSNVFNILRRTIIYQGYSNMSANQRSDHTWCVCSIGADILFTSLGTIKASQVVVLNTGYNQSVTGCGSQHWVQSKRHRLWFSTLGTIKASQVVVLNEDM